MSVMRVYSLISTELQLAHRAFEGERQISARNEKAMLRNLIMLCSRMLDEYPTSIRDDMAATYKAGMSVPMKNAIIVRKGEKEVLTNLKTFLETRRENLFP